jgi:hypothetical protein
LSSRFQFGTLLTDSSNVAAEYAAGVRVVHLELGWDQYEPQDGVFNTAYAASMKAKLQAFKQAGMQVVLGAGLQYPPAWVYSYPNSRYVNQYGVAAGPINLTFNSALRGKATAYLNRIAQDLGPQSFSAVRIGSGGSVETLYPDESDGTHNNSFWAYDANAQASSPFPGWKPGDTTYQGQPFSTASVQQWYAWYVQSLTDGVNWQIATYKAAGFTGDMQVLLPGQGVRPSDYTKAVNGYLAGAGDDNKTVGRGAVWNKVVDGLSDRQRVVLYVSSLADGSGWNDSCQASDASVSLTDSQIYNWSAARWVAYNANRYGLAKNGENPGRGDTNGYGKTMLQAAANQMQSCGFQGFLWAHDSNLYDGSGVSLADYQAVINQYAR